MAQFSIHNPIKYIYGENSFESLGEISKQCGTKALIVSYNQEHFIKLAEKAQQMLTQNGISSELFLEVEANPTVQTALKGLHKSQESKCDFLIGIGGGSALDTTKGIAHCMKHGEDILDYMYGRKVGTEVAPFILVPTTAGTGSEGNNFAVFTNPQTSDKKGVGSTALYAKYSILDPTLLGSLPPRIIAGPGLDALFHCIEAYTSRSCSPIIEVYALQAIKLIGESLEKMYKNPKDIEACQNMQMAALLGGICIGSSGVGIPHAIDHPIGGLYNIVHSDGLAALYPACMAFIVDAVPHKFARIGEALGQDIEEKPLTEQAKIGKQAVVDLIKKVGMETNLKSLNINPKDLDWIIQNTRTVMGIALNNSCVVPNEEQLRAIILSSF